MSRIIITIIAIVLTGCVTKSSQVVPFEWSETSEIPAPVGKKDQPGLAGALTGVSNDHLIIAGGANFPDALPWKGGTKVYNSTVYATKKDSNNQLIWIQSSDTLSTPFGYSANVAYQQGFISVGGESSDGPLSSVSYWTWDSEDNKIIQSEYPSLPHAITNASAAILNNKLYAIGGENQTEAFSDVWYLDLNDKKKGWQKGPQIPKPTSHSVAIVQAGLAGDQLYVVGGRSRQSSGISQLYNQVLKFDSKNSRWVEKSRIGNGTNNLPALSAAIAFAEGNYIYVLGGDDGQVFHKIETFAKKAKEAQSELERKELLSKQYELAEQHPGFSRDVFQYNTVKDEWKKLNPLPYAPVTTTAVVWAGEIFIPSGEIHPGIRTPKILRAKLSK